MLNTMKELKKEKKKTKKKKSKTGEKEFRHNLKKKTEKKKKKKKKYKSLTEQTGWPQWRVEAWRRETPFRVLVARKEQRRKRRGPPSCPPGI